jgi:hypothetical protein
MFPAMLCCATVGIVVQESPKEGRKMKNQLNTHIVLMDSGLSSAQFRV